MRSRAKRLADTRSRIVEATIAAHQAGDLSQVSITAIARRAGVSRLTVYRHFPDELSLLTACTSLYNDRHPLPDRSELQAIEDPVQRLRRGLADLYGYYAENQQMLSSGVAASGTHPALLVALGPWLEEIGLLGQVLAEAWGVDAGPGSLVAAAIGHATSFLTWQSLLTQQGATGSQAVDLMVSMVVAASSSSSTSRARSG